MGDFPNDILLFYTVGPFYIHVTGWGEKIKISWEDGQLAKQFLPLLCQTITDAWELEEGQIKLVSEGRIEIPLNYNTLLRYVDHAIIWI